MHWILDHGIFRYPIICFQLCFPDGMTGVLHDMMISAFQPGALPTAMLRAPFLPGLTLVHRQNHFKSFGFLLMIFCQDLGWDDIFHQTSLIYCIGFESQKACGKDTRKLRWSYVPKTGHQEKMQKWRVPDICG